MEMYDFMDRVKKVFAVDSLRANKLIEIAQYTLIFLLLVTFAAKLLNTYYYTTEDDAKYKQSLKKKSAVQLFFELFLDVLIIIVVFFYIRKIGLLVPSLPSLWSKDFKPYTTLEYSVHIALVVLFIEVLPKFKQRIEVWSEDIHDIEV